MFYNGMFESYLIFTDSSLIASEEVEAFTIILLCFYRIADVYISPIEFLDVGELTYIVVR